MPNIEIDFEKFLPSLGTFYNYFEILKSHNFIQGISVVQEKGIPMLRVLRSEPNEVAAKEKDQSHIFHT